MSDFLPHTMRYLSLCSGIEAATAAWHDLPGWSPVAFAEIEAFPSAVLAHHYPQVPNLGDMTLFQDWPNSLFLEVDLIVAGTPCQAFSIAGLRGSLADARGNLTLTLVQLLNHATALRHHAGRPAPLLLWENVPGVLSTDDNALGCFLADLAGEDDPLTPPGPRWTDAGFVSGPQRAIAWRLLDAQYFGLAQRRERLFLVASASDGPHPAQVLFESTGLRRDSPPRREPRQRPATAFETGPGGSRLTDLCPTLDTRCKDGPIRNQLGLGVLEDISSPIPEITGTLLNGGKTAGSATTQDAESGLLIPEAYGGNNTSGPIQIATAVRAHPSPQFDFESETFLVGPRCAASEDSSPLPFDTTQITSKTNRSQPAPGDPCHPLSAQAHPPAIAFSAKDNGQDATEELTPTLRACNHATSHANSGHWLAIAFSGRERGDDGRGYDRPPQVFGEITGAIETVKPHCVAFAIQERAGAENPNSGPAGIGIRADDCAFTLEARPVPQSIAQETNSPPENPVHPVQPSPPNYQVRRLTPTECERLQGFPDDYTLIPWRSNPAHLCPDGPRYKALGNSMAVPVMRWLAQRLTQ